MGDWNANDVAESMDLNMNAPADNEQVNGTEGPPTPRPEITLDGSQPGEQPSGDSPPDSRPQILIDGSQPGSNAAPTTEAAPESDEEIASGKTLSFSKEMLSNPPPPSSVRINGNKAKDTEQKEKEDEAGIEELRQKRLKALGNIHELHKRIVVATAPYSRHHNLLTRVFAIAKADGKDLESSDAPEVMAFRHLLGLVQRFMNRETDLSGEDVLWIEDELLVITKLVESMAKDLASTNQDDESVKTPKLELATSERTLSPESEARRRKIIELMASLRLFASKHSENVDVTHSMPAFFRKKFGVMIDERVQNAVELGTRILMGEYEIFGNAIHVDRGGNKHTELGKEELERMEGSLTKLLEELKKKADKITKVQASKTMTGGTPTTSSAATLDVDPNSTATQQELATQEAIAGAIRVVHQLRQKIGAAEDEHLLFSIVRVFDLAKAPIGAEVRAAIPICEQVVEAGTLKKSGHPLEQVQMSVSWMEQVLTHIQQYDKNFDAAIATAQEERKRIIANATQTTADLRAASKVDKNTRLDKAVETECIRLKMNILHPQMAQAIYSCELIGDRQKLNMHYVAAHSSIQLATGLARNIETAQIAEIAEANKAAAAAAQASTAASAPAAAALTSTPQDDVDTQLRNINPTHRQPAAAPQMSHPRMAIPNLGPAPQPAPAPPPPAPQPDVVVAPPAPPHTSWLKEKVQRPWVVGIFGLVFFLSLGGLVMYLYKKPQGETPTPVASSSASVVRSEAPVAVVTNVPTVEPVSTNSNTAPSSSTSSTPSATSSAPPVTEPQPMTAELFKKYAEGWPAGCISGEVTCATINRSCDVKGEDIRRPELIDGEKVTITTNKADGSTCYDLSATRLKL